MKKLCAVVLFAFLASFFAAGVAFAAVPAPVIRPFEAYFKQPAVQGVPILLKQSLPMLMSTDIASNDGSHTHSKGSWDIVAMFNEGQVDALVEVPGTGGVAVSRDFATDMADYLFPNLDPGLVNGVANFTSLVSVVVWSADTGGGTSVEPLVATMFVLSDDEAADKDGKVFRNYYGKRAKDIFAVKALGMGRPDGRAFTQVFSAADISDHTSAVVKIDGVNHTILGAEETLDPTKEYAILVAIRKGATNWDNSKATGISPHGEVNFANIIVDPMFVATVYPFDPFGVSFDIKGRRPDYAAHFTAASLPKVKTDIVANQPTVDTNLDDSLEVVNGMVWVKESVVTAYNYALENVQRLPVVSMDMNDFPNVAWFAQMIDTEKFVGKEAGQLEVVAVNNPTGGGKKFVNVYDGSLFADGKAVILKKNPAYAGSSTVPFFVPLSETEKLEAGKAYWIAVAVKDGGEYDFDKRVRYYTTPLFVAATGAGPVEPTNPFVSVPAIDGLPTGLATPEATVVHANLTETGLTTAAQGAVNTAGTEVDGGVQYYMSSTVASAILAAHEADLGTSPISQATVPVMKAALPTGTSAAAFAFPIASSFAGKTVGDVKFYKAVNGTAADAKEFELVQTGAAITDGKFAIVTSAGVVKTASETVATGDLVVYAIADGGDFDLDGAVNSSISDPVLVACDNTDTPTPPSGDSSSGCSVGGFAPATLLLLAPLFLLLKK